jgi:hypothetical protein
MSFWFNRDTDVVSETDALPDRPGDRFRLEIKGGKRVRTPGRMFWAGDPYDMMPMSEEEAWRKAEELAADENAASN